MTVRWCLRISFMENRVNAMRVKNRRIKVKYNTNCCVPQCHSRASRDPHLSFHQFPAENDQTVICNSRNVNVVVDRREEWILRLRIGKRVSTWMVVCSKHFRDEDFFPGPGRSQNRERARLKRTALPSLNLPVPYVSEKKKNEVRKNYLQKVKNRSINHVRWKKLNTDMKNTKSDKKDGADALLLLSCGDSITDLPGKKSALKSTTNNMDVSAEDVNNFPSTPEKLSKVSDNSSSCVQILDTSSSGGTMKKTRSDSAQAQVNSCNITKNNVLLTIFKDEAESEISMNSEEMFSENESDSEENLKEKLRILSENYKQSQKKLKEYQRLCKLYIKEVTALREVINNLKQINSVTDGDYFLAKS